MATHYVHGSSPEEQRRLGLMNTILNRACLHELALRGGERILDVGAGLGRFAREMAVAAGPAARIVAVERDERQLAAGRAALAGDPVAARIELRAGDAYDLPLAAGEPGTFDLAWSRFLLEHVADPQRVIAGMVRALRPGGRLVLADDDHELLRLDPDLPEFTAVWRAYQQTYRDHGNDPWIGRRLPALAHAAGARPVRNTWVFFGGCAGTADWETLIANCRGILVLAEDAIAAHLPAGAFAAGIAAFDAWAARAGASFWLPLAWVEAVKP